MGRGYSDAFLEWPLMAQCCRQSPTEQLTASHLRRGIGSARVVMAWNVDRLGRSLKDLVASCPSFTRSGASSSGGPPGERNGQYRHGERTKAAIAEHRKFSALLKMLRAGLELISDEHCVIELSR